MQPKIIVFLLLIATTVYWGCSPESFTDQKDEIFPLYIASDIEIKHSGIYKTFAVIDHYVQISRNITLDQKIEFLLEQLSKRYFSNLSIELKEIKITDRASTLYINLAESSGYNGPGSLQLYQSWFDFFQGSHGGMNTQIILTESLLQRHYQGDWVDALVVYYQGNPFGDFDHVDLRGTIFRYN
ncbi:MAG: hypothetical protein ACNA7V_10100 [Bacteroidales bacterium]